MDLYRARIHIDSAGIFQKQTGGIQMDRKAAGELLLYFLNSASGEIRTDKIKQLSADDWDEILKLSVNHNIVSMLYHIFDTTKAIDHIPTEFAGKFRYAYLYNVKKSMQLLHRFSRVLTVLQKEDIPVIILKGAALTELIYPNIALRPMSDVDMLVRTEDIWRLDNALSRSGFRSNIASLLSKRHIQWARHVFYKNEAMTIEVHPRIPELPKLNPWANTVPTTIASSDALMLSLEPLLLHLCCHLDNHLCVDRITMLIWWYDIAEILRRYRDEIDWDYVVRGAVENDVEGSVHRVLHLVSEWFDTHVPADVLFKLKDDGIIVSTDDVIDMECVKHEPDSLTANVAAISKIPSFYGRIYHIFRSVFPCKEYMIHQYSLTKPARVYLYYFVRIGKGTARTAKFLYQLPGYLKGLRYKS